jgi:3D (Asp-Asp-Asp) domain-containing protein
MAPIRIPGWLPALRRAPALGLLAAAALALAADRLTVAHPGWVAAVVNAGHALGVSPYRAAPFRRTRPIPYPATTVPDPALPAGLHQVRTPGHTGTLLEIGVAYYRQAAGAPGAAPAAPADEKVLASAVLARPTPAVVAVGTAPDLVGPIGGTYYHYSRVLDMIATAYDATWASNGPWTGQRSALGLPLHYGVVAVDPRVIPLGSRLYVEQYGLAVAADTGSAIVGNRIDLFFWTDPAQTAAFGIRHLKVYVLDDPRLPPVPVPPALRRALT